MSWVDHVAHSEELRHKLKNWLENLKERDQQVSPCEKGNERSDFLNGRDFLNFLMIISVTRRTLPNRGGQFDKN
jgi:hypothetical protein